MYWDKIFRLEDPYQGAAVTTAVDPNIKWEETETVDGGFEAVLWKGLLKLQRLLFS